MSITKHKLFTVNFSTTNSIEADKKSLEEVNTFLKTDNYVYLNHSITIITESKREMGSYKLNNKTLLISLIYKDLSDTSLDISKSSKKTKEIIKNSVVEDEGIEIPKVETEFEKKLKFKEAYIQVGRLFTGNWKLSFTRNKKTRSEVFSVDNNGVYSIEGKPTYNLSDIRITNNKLFLKKNYLTEKKHSEEQLDIKSATLIVGSDNLGYQLTYEKIS